MIVYVYPADAYGCGHYRLIWPALALQKQGHDVRVIPPSGRHGISGEFDQRTGKLAKVILPEDADVIVMQRVSLAPLAQAIRLLREERRPVGVVVDMDDDLRSIDPANPAFYAMHPKYGKAAHTADNAMSACLDATLVTVSTPALLPIYAPHGRGQVLYNRVPEGYLDIPHTDGLAIGWPGSVHSHPYDLQTVGSAVARLLREGHAYYGVGDGAGVRGALGLEIDPPTSGALDVNTWPYGVATLGVGMAPLADTVFNRSKSWLKPLEMSATGVPWVASPRVEYARFHRDNRVGVLAKNPREWYRELKRLVSDDAWRLEQSQAGRAAASVNTIEGHAWRWMEAWTAAGVAARKAAPAMRLPRGR